MTDRMTEFRTNRAMQSSTSLKQTSCGVSICGRNWVYHRTMQAVVALPFRQIQFLSSPGMASIKRMES